VGRELTQEDRFPKSQEVETLLTKRKKDIVSIAITGMDAKQKSLPVSWK
jgi:hypothetical protein